MHLFKIETTSATGYTERIICPFIKLKIPDRVAELVSGHEI